MGELLTFTSGYMNPASSGPAGYSFGGLTFFISITDDQHYPVTKIPPMQISLQRMVPVQGAHLFLYDIIKNLWEDAVATCTPPNVTIAEQTNTITFSVSYRTAIPNYCI